LFFYQRHIYPFTMIKGHLLAVLICLAIFIVCGNNVMYSQCENDFSPFPFKFGVASGDATETHVVLWTHIDALGQEGYVEVKWTVALDTAFNDVVLEGEMLTSVEKDFTVKVDVGPLTPGTWYYYCFSAFGLRSEIGRTRTLSSDNEPFTFAAFSCSRFDAGFFNAYNNAFEEDRVQAIVHLGDFYYEYARSSSVSNRFHEPVNELYSLDDYRTRIAQVIGDPDTRELRRQFPWYVIWDDHEFANDAWSNGAPGHNSDVMSWQDRMEAARRSYFEWMPVRDHPQHEIQRHFSIGNLCGLNFLDTRVKGRDQQVSASSIEVDDSLRTIIGEEQFDVLVHDLVADSLKRWNLIFSGVMMTKAVNSSGQPIDPDTWEGYRYERNRLWQTFRDSSIQNIVCISGDYHSSWASDLPFDDYDVDSLKGSAGCELVVCATTSSPHTVGDIDTFKGYNPHVKHIEQSSNGYLLCQINSDEVRAQWKYVSTVTAPEYEMSDGQAISIAHGLPFVQLDDVILEPEVNEASKAPFGNQVIYADPSELGLQSLRMFPNPSTELCHILWTGACGRTNWKLFSANGELVYSFEVEEPHAGLHHYKLNTQQLLSGVYFLNIKSNDEEIVTRLVVVDGL